MANTCTVNDQMEATLRALCEKHRCELRVRNQQRHFQIVTDNMIGNYYPFSGAQTLWIDDLTKKGQRHYNMTPEEAVKKTVRAELAYQKAHH